MSVAIVQETAGDTGAGTPSSYSVTLPVATTAGNSVVIICTSDATVSTPAGFTLDKSQINNNGHYTFRKTTAGAETGWTLTPSVAAAGCWYAVEIAGLVSSPVDVTASTGSVTGDATRSTGTTSSTTQPLTVAFASWGSSAATNPAPLHSGQTNSFFERINDRATTKTSGTNIGLSVAAKVLTAAGTVESTATLTPGAAGTAMVVVYKIAGAAFRAAGTSVDSASTSVVGTPTMTVPAGVVSTDTAFVVVSWVGAAAEAPGTYTGSGGGWSTVVAPGTYNNMGFACYSKTGLTAGNTFTFTGSVARLYTCSHVYWSAISGFGTPGAVTSRAGVSIATTTAAAITTTQTNQPVIIVSVERTTATGTTISSVSPAATQRAYYEGTGNSTNTVYVGDFLGAASPAATSARTITYNSASGNGAALQVPVLAPTAGLTRATQALPDTDRVRAAALTANGNTVRVAVSTDSGMGSPVFGWPSIPDAQGYTRHTIAGLTANTDYWWQVEVDGTLLGTVGRARTFPAAGPAAFSFLAASCSFTGSTHAVFTTMKDRTGPGARRPLFLSHMGDLHYAHSGGGIAPNDPADHRTNYEAGLQSSTQAPLYRDVPLSHSWSDNDFCGSNSDSTFAGLPAAVAVRRQVLVDPPLADTANSGLWVSWVVGRVRFIRTDSRTYMSAKAATDNASKSMLGTEQRTWLLARFADPEPVKVWFHDNAWAGNQLTPGTVDTWQVFHTERLTIAAATAGVRLVYVHGDAHRLSADDGTNNPYGGFPMIGCAPMDQDAQHTQPVTVQSSYPAPAGADITPAHLYGWFDVSDTDDVITVEFTGYDSAGTARVTQTTVFDLTASTQQRPVMRGAGRDRRGVFRPARFRS